ncbi:type 2 isopentenyl-diphosphate Delta-isomerase [Lacticaseibacillus suilingensis]|uniref:Isopentenyl-diphosphate delta-isomerase n=1 Tax=Lacticaseibacillus suilingensis TaxID=2799577 RepID=A0ABW4BHM7_9LACO|nr:type 2 isopentenyl-diphosphate Delta-isomerase [Lacticaseibacillus suilingensis]
MAQSLQSHRKDEHVFLAEKYFQAEASAGFDQVRFIHNPLPETAVAAVDLTPGLFGWRWPFFINAMTGGSAQTGRYSEALATIAKHCGLAMATGSQSVALAEPALAETFARARTANPKGFMIGNLGADKTLAQAQTAVAMLQADALELHLNAVQETVMPEGDADFHWAESIQAIVVGLDQPVIVKEVGFGMNREALAKLRTLGVQYVDLGGRGGTNFALIEGARRQDQAFADLADFGQTTVESLLEAQGSELTLLATGGIRTPLDVLKALRLGASAVGISGLVLHWLIQEGQAAAEAHLQAWQTTLPKLMAMLGAQNLAALRQVPVVLSPALVSYTKQRNLPLP